ncbi:MAG: hypothetical protein GYB65_12630 [Chloroflexi bacterium]|nr:hypothetical protein [Chloroflexota bacterium]
MPQSRLLIPESQWRRMGRVWRTGRAVWRNARVVWREFRWPILVFAVAVFGGGWLYGELLVQAGEERLPYFDLPYTMLALMILETPDEIPREPELVAFWYVMPVVAAYVAGRGVFDFIRLFFNPDARRTSWEEAVASTYRQHVIVLGVGHLGLRVVRALHQMGVDVVAIDRSLDPESGAEVARMKIPLIVNDGRLASTLETAGIRKAQALIVCTSNDHMNLEVTMRARDLNKGLRIVVRMWDARLNEQIRGFMHVDAVLSTTNLAAPSFAGYALGVEITQTLEIDGVPYSMIRMKVAPGSFLDGTTVGAAQRAHDMDIVLLSQNDHVDVHPMANKMINSGDTLAIFARHDKITAVIDARLDLEPGAAASTPRDVIARNHVIVLGVGHLGLRVVRELDKMGVGVVAIDRRIVPERGAELERMGVPLVGHDGRLVSTLEAAGIHQAQALIVCTSDDHLNLEVTMHARDLNPRLRIVLRKWEDQLKEQIRHFFNVEAVLSATNLAAPLFACHALGIEITQTLEINDVAYSMIHMEVAPGSFLDGATVGVVQHEHDMDIVLLGQNSHVDVHPPAEARIKAGDTLVVFAHHNKITDVVARNQRQRFKTV